jgi:uncharacterized protein
MDTVMDIWKQDEKMHIYHFGAYEQSALKRLVGKYATREDELDRLLACRGICESAYDHATFRNCRH